MARLSLHPLLRRRTRNSVAARNAANPSGNGDTIAANPTPRRFGDYELLELIAGGGMGIVWRARQAKLDRVVALKVLRVADLPRLEDTERFQSEALAIASLQHPHIVALHDFGNQDGQPWFSMDLIEGQTLAQFLREKPLPPIHAADLLKTITEAVAYAHSRGILHRDLKPSNILIDRQGHPWITDFGLAKRFTVPEPGTPRPQLTLSGQLLGTPNYAPPEQLAVHRGTMGPHSDVYALGAVLYEMLTGRPPFLTPTLEATLLQVIDAHPTKPSRLNPSVPTDIEIICLKCLEKAPEQRYATARELADELGRFLRAEPIRALPIGTVAQLGRWCKRKPGWATASMLALVLLGTLVTLTAIASKRLVQKRRAMAAVTSSGLAVPVNLQNATATFSQSGFPVRDAIDGDTARGGWAIYKASEQGDQTHPQTAVFETASDVGFQGGTLLTFKLTQNGGRGNTIGRFRLSVTTDDRKAFADGLQNGGNVTANWVVLDPIASSSLAASGGRALTKLSDSSILPTGPRPNVDTYTVTLPTSLVGITGVRLEVLPYTVFPTEGPGLHEPDGNFVLTELEMQYSAAWAILGGLPAEDTGGGTAQQVIKFIDTDFVDSNWELHALTEPSLLSVVRTQIIEASGSHRSFQRITTTLGGGSNAHSQTLSVQLNHQATYVPNVHGAIAFLDYAEDCRVFSTEFNTFGGCTAPALMQNNLLYVANGFIHLARDDHTSPRLPSPWKEIRISRLHQDDFSLVTGPESYDPARHPDFSLHGPPIVFGYAQPSTHTSSEKVIRQKDTDNWSIAIYSRSASQKQ